MTHRLTSKDILALGFMTFALFVGAGNIIFPPMVGIQSGEHVWTAAIGFLITAVGLPVMTVIALARVGGGVDALSTPIGKGAGLLLATVCYLAVGPLFATPRTATVSFEMGIAPLTGDGALPLFVYSFIYFALVIGVSLYPGKLLDTVGHFLAPLKIVALTVLGIAALIWPAGTIAPATEDYQRAAFSSGFVNGYLTMDTLGALVFGIVIVNAARSRGVESASLLTRYTVMAGLIAGVGLTLVYLSLFKLGNGSGALVAQSANGAAILHAYVQQTFGGMGSFFLAALIFVACMVTAVGLTCACAEFFAQYLPLSYKALVFILGLFSMVVSNLGLSHLIQISIPVLTAIYPPCIVLIVLSFTLNWWNKSSRLIAPTMLVSLIFGIIDGVKTTSFKDMLPAFSQQLPLADQGLAWLPPALVMLLIAAIVDRVKGREQVTAHS
ncbi:MAG: branched-chain amino acid transporter carrier protein BrnQ [Pantoea sp.]|jgi:LIVCS family branched-chain amino acid:cation transporter|uniref:branched-chain amino acid transporter carrier protein BrnQ n=3 Tax=Erwiniaceae TaxID=1903409 RepID=UPI00065FA010|nr:MULTISPECIES: branched-chain amino acid transporter carrier protein BrnQ [Pantoea]MBS6435933.1 branched-chain amino acid transporter carrier protein BrnQ [Pantoea sp.]MDU1573204.1 branched-chain amino acid transporter carrier protein BrnQ [Pantoea sp.]MDU2728804.1 branched-chain amino acid transporter carrier protein BrnQ [Pantoea sp.]MDU5472505.1 branched-chain amino acid transporter carrier protein BrnQ [Pantoea sp.]MDU6080137.1 branched-chain amino acid transporter carrier protein BrnQ [